MASSRHAGTSSISAIILEMLTVLLKRKEPEVDSLRAQRVKTLAHELANFLRWTNPDMQTKLQFFSKELHSTLELAVLDVTFMPHNNPEIS